MSEMGTFAGAAKGLARNPLGIIALFIVLIYGFAALTLGMTSTLQPTERLPLVWFLVLFPVVVLAVFAWLVSQHHEKLYAPGDFKSDDGFLESAKKKLAYAREIEVQQERVKVKVGKAIAASRSDSANASVDVEALVRKVNEEIDSATNVRIDASAFLKESGAIFELPVALFDSLGELTDAVYFKLAPAVKPYAYGYTWVLRNEDTGEIVRTARMISGAEAGKPMADNRSLEEVGILPGSCLTVVSPAVR